MRGKQPKAISVIRAIGWVTFLEIIRDKVLYNIALCAALLLGIGVLASKLTTIHPERVVVDFGLSAVMISCCAIAVFTGSGLLGREIERRTISVALSHPISRVQFILGKFLGLAGVLLTNWLLLVVAYLVIVGTSSAHGPNGYDTYSPIMIVALGLAFLASLLMASIAVFFSSFSTTSLSVILSVGFYLVGNNITQMKLLASKTNSPLMGVLLNWLALLWPNFEHFNLGTRVTYGLPVSWSLVSFSILYGFFMVALFLILGGLFIQGREV